REALDCMRAALELWPSSEEPETRRGLLRELARCASACSDHAWARAALGELANSIAPDASPGELVELKRLLAQAASDDGDRLEARALLAEAAPRAPAAGLYAVSVLRLTHPSNNAGYY